MAFTLAAALTLSANARGAICAASPYEPRPAMRDAAILEASRLSVTGQWADARAIYLWVLARHPDDGEALFGLARIDAWEGCWALAADSYRRALARHPRDSDLRAGYVDLLLWQGKYDEAEQLLEAGLALDPASPSLLARRARLAYWRGDATAGVRTADEAESLAPDETDLRALRNKMFVGEARLTLHLDRYPASYQDLYSVSAQVLERMGRFELYGGAQLLERLGGDVSAVTDARYPVGLSYHPAVGVAIGAEVAAGAPAHAIPDASVKTWVLAPLSTLLSGSIAYSFWHFDNGELVHILNPAVEAALPAGFRVMVRAWISQVRLPQPGGEVSSKLAGAFGGQVAWSATPMVDVGVSYTYGVQLDQNPTFTQLLAVRSHVFGGYADALLDRHKGLRPLLSIERRQGSATEPIWIVSGEVGGYVRW